jgi:hypothetical protein
MALSSLELTEHRAERWNAKLRWLTVSLAVRATTASTRPGRRARRSVLLEPRQQQEEEGGAISASVVARSHPPPDARPPSARQLVDGLYRGLGHHLDDLTAAIRARELAIAEQLVGVGATPAQAEAYAREMSTFGNRLAPINLRSFERERASWLARRRAARAGDVLGSRTPKGAMKCA